MREWRDLELNTTPNDRFFFSEKLFRGKFYLLSEFLPEIGWEEIAEEIFFSYFVLLADLDTIPGFTSNKSTHDLLDYDTPT